MKFLLSIIILYSMSFTSFCDCAIYQLPEKYIESGFVADITILKLYPNQKNKKGHKADIKINKLFKGKRMKSIYVYGLNDEDYEDDDGFIKDSNSCDLYIPVNTRLIAYAKKNKDGNFGIGMCSGLLYLNKVNKENQKAELELLESMIED